MRRWFVLVMVLLGGCAQAQPEGAPPSGGGAFEERAAEVAEAWRSSALAESWRHGFVPLQDLVVLPENVTFSGDTKMAYGNGWFRTVTQLSTKVPADSSIRFPDGQTISVPLVSAAAAYRSIDRGDPPCDGETGVAPKVQTGTPESPPAVKDKVAAGPCTALTVTGAKLGTVQLRTSRGVATVPAWLFTVDELAGPLARVAVAPSAVSDLPSPSPAPDQPGIVGAVNLTKVDGATLTYGLGVGACDKDITPLFYEADDVVVVGGQVGSRPTGPCVLSLLIKPVTVTLGAPLGDRVVLDISGKPLTP